MQTEHLNLFKAYVFYVYSTRRAANYHRQYSIKCSAFTCLKFAAKWLAIHPAGISRVVSSKHGGITSFRIEAILSLDDVNNILETSLDVYSVQRDFCAYWKTFKDGYYNENKPYRLTKVIRLLPTLPDDVCPVFTSQ